MVAIVPRSAWGARFPIPAGRHVALSARRFVVLHWPGGTAGPDPAQNVRNIERFHVETQRWPVIGYNALVSRDGRIWEGCGRDTRGVHTEGRNTDGLGVCCLISIGEPPPPAMLASCAALTDEWSRAAGRRLALSWHAAHNPTACPGPDLIAWARAGGPAPGREDDDMTPEQATMLAEIHNILEHGQRRMDARRGWLGDTAAQLTDLATATFNVAQFGTAEAGVRPWSWLVERMAAQDAALAELAARLDRLDIR